MPDPFKPVMAFYVTVALGAAAFLLWGYSHMEVYCVFYPDIDTQYAPGFSEAGFNKIAIGDGIDSVEATIGQPLYTQPLSDGSTQWWYSSDGRCAWGDFAWKGRSLQVNQGEVISKESRVYND